MAAPKRELFKAAEVCEVVQVQPYVLRSWEAEFPQIGQAPAGGGARLYRRADIELVLRIKQLVFDEGLTLSGARRRLEEDGDQHTAPVSVDELLGAGVREKLKSVKSGLQSILQMLSNDAADQGELRLVPPSAPAPARAKKKPVAKAKAKK
jgi:DNA-binding transcriptional MerR regulator